MGTLFSVLYVIGWSIDLAKKIISTRVVYAIPNTVARFYRNNVTTREM